MVEKKCLIWGYIMLYKFVTSYLLTGTHNSFVNGSTHFDSYLSWSLSIPNKHWHLIMPPTSNQSTDITGGSIVSECKLGKWSWTYHCFIYPLTSCNLSKQCRPWSDAAFCGFWSGLALFANVPNAPVQVLQITLCQQHSDLTVTKKSMAINHHYLHFV